MWSWTAPPQTDDTRQINTLVDWTHDGGQNIMSVERDSVVYDSLDLHSNLYVLKAADGIPH